MLTFAKFLIESTNPSGPQIKKAMSSDAAYKILDSHPETKGSTWHAGGCGVLAHAIHRHLPGSKLVDVHNKTTGNTEHVAVQHGPHIYDANGKTPIKGFLDRFKKQEGLSHHDLVLTDHDPARTAKSEISTHPATVEKTYQHLKSVFK